MKAQLRPGLAAIIAAACLLPVRAPAASTNVHTSFHWHMHQPIYWPDRRDYGADHYEAAWDTRPAAEHRPAPPPPGSVEHRFRRGGPCQRLSDLAARCAVKHPKLPKFRRVDELLRRSY